METFTTATGKKYECPYMSEAPAFGKLYIAINTFDFITAASLFSNKQEMASISYAGITKTGYTHLDFITQEPYGIKACLSKEVT